MRRGTPIDDHTSQWYPNLRCLRFHVKRQPNRKPFYSSDLPLWNIPFQSQWNDVIFSAFNHQLAIAHLNRIKFQFSTLLLLYNGDRQITNAAPGEGGPAELRPCLICRSRIGRENRNLASQWWTVKTARSHSHYRFRPGHAPLRGWIKTACARANSDPIYNTVCGSVACDVNSLWVSFYLGKSRAAAAGAAIGHWW